MSVIHLYVGNHGKREGIEDYISFFTATLGARGISVRIGDRLVPDATNLVIDEFTNVIENRKIASLRRSNPRTRVILVLTEFVRRKWGVESFNHFGGLHDSAMIAVFSVAIRILRRDFPGASVRDFLLAAAFAPVMGSEVALQGIEYLVRRLLGRKTDRPVQRILSANHRRFYLHMRYLGLRANLRYADAAIASHECIMESMMHMREIRGGDVRFLGVIYPELDEKSILEKLMVGKNLWVELTGSVTPYRQKWIGRINRQIRLSGLEGVIGRCRAFSFSSLRSGAARDCGAYSLHPPQTKSWPYCSPTRIFRALSIDYNLPVLTRRFGQNPIEEVCYLYQGAGSLVDFVSMYHDRERLISYVAPKLMAYNEIVGQRNDDLAKKVVDIINDEPIGHVQGES